MGSTDRVILVEGINDVRSLESIGVHAEFFTVQCSGGPVRAIEYLESRKSDGMVMTDWDRRGDMLAERLSELAAGSCDLDLSVRKELGRLCSGYVTDVESLGPWLSRVKQF